MKSGIADDLLKRSNTMRAWIVCSNDFAIVHIQLASVTPGSFWKVAARTTAQAGQSMSGTWRVTVASAPEPTVLFGEVPTKAWVKVISLSEDAWETSWRTPRNTYYRPVLLDQSGGGAADSLFQC